MTYIERIRQGEDRLDLAAEYATKYAEETGQVWTIEDVINYWYDSEESDEHDRSCGV